MSQDVASGCSSFDQSLFEAVAFAREGGSPRLEQQAANPYRRAASAQRRSLAALQDGIAG